MGIPRMRELLTSPWPGWTLTPKPWGFLHFNTLPLFFFSFIVLHRSCWTVWMSSCNWQIDFHTSERRISSYMIHVYICVYLFVLLTKRLLDVRLLQIFACSVLSRIEDGYIYIKNEDTWGHRTHEARHECREWATSWLSRMNEACHEWMRHVTNEACHEWGMSRMRHVTNETCHEWGMSRMNQAYHK